MDMNYKYDSLLDENPDIQERVAKGQAEGEIRGAQKMVEMLVEARFPTLAELAQERVARIRNTETLAVLLKQVATVSDESTARWVLNTFAA